MNRINLTFTLAIFLALTGCNTKDSQNTTQSKTEHSNEFFAIGSNYFILVATGGGIAIEATKITPDGLYGKTIKYDEIGSLASMISALKPGHELFIPMNSILTASRIK